jgi:hypothetical protein
MAEKHSRPNSGIARSALGLLRPDPKRIKEEAERKSRADWRRQYRARKKGAPC